MAEAGFLWDSCRNTWGSVKSSLRNTHSHLSEERLCDTLETNIDGDLHLLAREADASAKEKLTEWMDLMERLDAKRKMELKRQREVATDEVQTNLSAK